MGVEIERRFLVKMNQEELMKILGVDADDGGIHITQGYLLSSPEKSIRIRRSRTNHIDEGFITVKGKKTGASGSEFEYPIQGSIAQQMISDLCDPAKVIHKVRYRYLAALGVRPGIRHLWWEVDIFDGANQGLIIVEIELPSEDFDIEIPEWVDEEITSDSRYSNARLYEKPFIHWEDA